MKKILITLGSMFLLTTSFASDYQALLGNFEGKSETGRNKCTMHNTVDSKGRVSLSITDSEGTITYPKLSGQKLQDAINAGYQEQFQIVGERKFSLGRTSSWYLGGLLQSETGDFFLRIKYEVNKGGICVYNCTLKSIDKICSFTKDSI